MGVYWINLPQSGEPSLPCFEDIRHLLEYASIRYGIDYKAIELSCEKMRHGLSTGVIIPIAQGKPSQPGTKSRLDFSLDVAARPGTLREDGSIDFKELNLMPLVGQDQLIGTRIPATKGILGTDVFGQEITAEDGQEVVIRAGKNVRLEEKKGQPDSFYSEIKGGLDILRHTVQTKTRMRQEIKLAVYPIREVHGDVDYGTGDINHPGSVFITGSVKAGFNVTAEGSVAIEGHVENKVSIQSKGNLAVRQGIAGGDTRIKAEGSVHAKYISGATVCAKGDMTIGNYILNATVHAEGSVTVFNPHQIGRKKGAIIGGTTLAIRQIQAQNIGSDTASGTCLVSGVDLSLLKKTSSLQKNLNLDQLMINRLMQFLHLERPEMLEIRECLQKAQGAQKKKIAASVKKLLELLVRQSKAVTEKEEANDRLQELALAACISVSGRVHRDTSIRIGGHQTTVQENAESVTFSLVEEEETIRLKMT